jgi:Zn-dependent protease with chaperone function
VLPIGWAPFIAVIGLGIAWSQWYFSDTMAMKAMGAREVSAEDAPELHGMIVRILTEGQLEVADDQIDRLNELDSVVQKAVDLGDESGFRTALAALLDGVRSAGTPLPDDSLQDSDFILPPADGTLDEVRALLNDDGLIPG